MFKCPVSRVEIQMTRHPRLPALIASLGTAALGLTLLATTGQFHSPDLTNTSLDSLERQIIGSTDPSLWCAYAEKLQAAGRYSAAAEAYQRALKFQPDLQAARSNTAIALAQANSPDAFFAYFSRLTALYPKLAVDLLERPELSSMHGDPRWDLAASSAKVQAID
jgi:tetratricopeptide (TPR) repeat protein